VVCFDQTSGVFRQTVHLNQRAKSKFDIGGDLKIASAVHIGNYQMAELNSVIAVFDDHHAAEVAVKKLADAGTDIKNLSVVGKGFHTDEHVIGFYNAGDRVKFWGKRGAFWGGLWGWLFGGIFMFIPVVGHVVMVGYFAAAVLAAIEGAVVVGGASALAAALYSIGIPKDSVIAYESAVKADGFLVMAHGSAAEVDRAKKTLEPLHPSRVDVHEPLAEHVA
jgi:hypothetical protein